MLTTSPPVSSQYPGVTVLLNVLVSRGYSQEAPSFFSHFDVQVSPVNLPSQPLSDSISRFTVFLRDEKVFFSGAVLTSLV